MSRYGYWLCLFALGLPFIYYAPGLDMAISNYFYDAELAVFPSHEIFDFFTTWGVVPAQIVAVLAGCMLILTWILPAWAAFRKYALLLVIPMALGAGLIVHPLLKDHWGRPRPRQVDALGGEEPFRPFYQPNFTWKSHHKSFPCGHCTMGFYFISLIYLGRRLQSRVLVLSALALTIVLGAGLSIARIAQGGHFFSDTIVTALIMWFVAWATDRYLFIDAAKEQKLPCKG